MLPQKNPTIDLTATSDSDHYSVDKDDDKEYYLLTQNLITTDDEENDETEYQFELYKPSHIAEVKIDTTLPSPISAARIAATKSQVFQVLKYFLIYHQIMYHGNH